MQLELEQFGDGESLVLDESEISDLTATANHTAIGSLEARLVGTREIEPFVQRQARVTLRADDGDAVWTGVAIESRVDRRQAKTRLRAAGIEKLLEEDGPFQPVQYSNISLADAIRDYWDEYTRFENVTVTDEDTETVASDQEVYAADTTDEWEQLVSLGFNAERPLTVENGRLKLQQTCWTVESEDNDSGDAFEVSDPQYSGGTALNFTSAAALVGRWQFTPEYQIPAGELEIAYRNEGLQSPPDIEWRVNGTVVDTTNAALQLRWSTINFDIGSLPAGNQVTIAAESVANNGGERRIDVVAPRDRRFSYTDDNDNGGNGGFLDGPQLYPASQDVLFDTKTLGFNIGRGRITSTWDNTANNQQVAVSNDGGDTFVTAANTETLDEPFPDPGRNARARVRLSRYGSRTVATPQTGFEGQKIDQLRFGADLNDLTVIDALELSRNNFENLKTLHNYGSFVFAVDYDGGSVTDIPIFSFSRGGETRPLPDDAQQRTNERVETATAKYANEIRLEGALDENGDRPVSIAFGSDAVAADGRRIKLRVRDPTIKTLGGAQFRANALLERVLEEDRVRGRITTLPTFATPGFARPVSFLDDPERELTVESVQTRLSSDGLESTLNFVPRQGLNERINELQRNLRDTGNQV